MIYSFPELLIFFRLSLVDFFWLHVWSTPKKFYADAYYKWSDKKEIHFSLVLDVDEEDSCFSNAEFKID